MARSQWGLWLAYALLWVTMPWFFSSSLGINLLSQIGIAIIVCLSYNLLLGQGGMLSFGHAVYSGLGAFLAIHTLNAVSAGQLSLPVSLIPLAGGLSGLAVALLLGWVSTQKAATPFAMITLGVGELVWAMSLMFPGFFGGEGGISGNRVTGPRPFGISFGPQIELYGLIAVYAWVCTWLLYAFTRTPLGRLLNAVRDNPERVAFVGYDPRMVRYIAFCIAAFFAGIGGGLAALHFEIVTSEVVSAQRSGAFLLFVFLGGASFFIGPILGAVLIVVAGVLMSEWTQAWLLYLGLLFVLMVMFVPGGLAGLLLQHLRLHQAGQGGALWAAYARLLPVAALGLSGLAVLIEMIYHLQLNAALTPRLQMGPIQLNTDSTSTWVGVVTWATLGLLALAWVWRSFARRWSAMQDAARRTLHPAQELTDLTPPETLPLDEPKPHPHHGQVALSIHGLHKRFGATEIIRGVDLEVRHGERVALIGPNGAGKSTLFNLISGRFAPTTGRVQLGPHDISGRKPQAIHRLGLSRSFQITHIFQRLSVIDNLRCSVLHSLGHGHCFWRDLDQLPDVTGRAERLLADVRLAHRRDEPAMNLTYAEQRALELGITLGSGADLILLDEPTAGMSRSETAYMIGLIRRLTQGKTLIMVEHDMDVVFGLADRVAVLVYGQVIAFDTPERVRADPAVREAYLGEPVGGQAC
ncbi:MAG: transporter permease [Pseudomonadota bacterium]|jgi:branched-chain amino acid transport system permease protein